MSAQLRAELLKQRSTPTGAALLVSMLGLVLFAVLLHALTLAAAGADSRAEQLTMVFGWGEALGALFAALLGAVSITSEFRYGTIRPTFLITPQRGRPLAAKVRAGMLLGFAYGLVAAIAAAAAGGVALEARGIDIQLGAGDDALLLAGGAGAGALWGALGVGLGSLLRNQVATIAAICLWLLFVENLLVAFVPDFGRLMPGAAGAAFAGQDPATLLAPGIGAVLLALYSATTVATGWVATIRRDVP
jgi:hypothetical protein